MTDKKPKDGIADALLNIDSEAREAAVPHKEDAPVKALSWYSEIGDQPQLRALSAGLIAAGALRRDQRMMRAGTRMLLAHELATLAKNFVKKRVDRTRPRSADDEEDQKAELGRSEEKEETSFPSGHSAGATAVAAAFAREYPEYKLPALAAGGLVALAQIPRCAHYPTDVGAGIAIGAAAEACVGLVWRAPEPDAEDEP
jgi:membrane-associated phospholipid phosphatase